MRQTVENIKVAMAKLWLMNRPIGIKILFNVP